ncbi:MAG: type II toxin-antitoxin system VapC family toxin [Acidimicrobiales bacterium]|nr:type II toxin-antitoxin system VapC family toxin [Acidimicrobiales bacterium]MYH75100.1 type II toxin-antitoxin system VapC family toxin [Acidimicrobiales bacterium]MYK71020.1 type II toxin-antitoxin system VapC family toxin [Acidimicrobiales bacterium]
MDHGWRAPSRARECCGRPRRASSGDPDQPHCGAGYRKRGPCVRYWDTSALVPLFVAEPTTDAMRSWLREDGVIVTWAWTKVEIVSAVERRTRDGDLTRAHRRSVMGRLDEFSESWHEVVEMLAVRSRASSMLARHSLRAADAAQLGAAVHVQEQIGVPLQLVVLDRRLAEAAEREGLAVVSA